MSFKLDRGRCAALLCAGLILSGFALSLIAPQDAAAGRYVVAQCDPLNRASADAVYERRNPGDYGFERRCEEDEEANTLQIRVLSAAPAGHFGRISWAAPSGVGIVAVAVEARLRSNSGHQARLGFHDANGNELGRIATGRDEAAGFERFSRSLTDAGRPRFAASLVCNGPGRCPHSEQARAWLRSVRLTLLDRVPPTLALSGSLLSPGWHRGSGAVAAVATDAGSGVRAIDVGVAGRAPESRLFPCATIPGTAISSRMRPCASRQGLSRSFDTRARPFVNGPNRISVCARDFGSGGTPTCIQRMTLVDNAPPSAAFANARDPEDPELIRAPASDAHSGLRGGTIAYRPAGGGSWRLLPTTLAGGELRARVDSASEPPGRYLFRLTASDRVGNARSSTLRRDGSPMTATFPLRERTRLEASIDGSDQLTVDYGERPMIRGVLRNGSGRPIAGESIDLVERFDSGSSLETIERSARTDSRGRFAARVSRGPSRRITVSYRGTRRYLSAPSQALRLRVRSSARMAISAERVRAGRKVLFHGNVGSFGAIVDQGKLVELQVKGGGIRRFRTVRQAFRTDPRGSWSMRYGFDRFYERPTRFRFRLKVASERGWPYLTPASSKTRGLRVIPRR